MVEGEPKDSYYQFLKRRGAMDYVDDILLPGEEIGMRVDSDFVYAPTVCVIKKIDVFNLRYVLTSIGFTGLTHY